MTNQQLYIDDQLMDMDDKTKITLDIKSNLLRDVTSMTSNYTYTIQLPKTLHNLSVLEHANVPKAETKCPYVYHHCRYIRNGLEIIKEGRLTVLNIADTIEVSIYWGLFPAFCDLQKSDMKLNELKTDAHVKLVENTNADSYDTAVANGYFFAEYNSARVDTADRWTKGQYITSSAKSKKYALVEGKIETGEAVGKVISGVIVSDSTYNCAIVPFTAGFRASINNIISSGIYRTWAVLDEANKVIALSEDGKTTGILNDFSLSDGESQPGGMYYMNVITEDIYIESFKVAIWAGQDKNVIEYGVIEYDLNGGDVNIVPWGTFVLRENNDVVREVTVGKKKTANQYFYVKLNKDDYYYNASRDNDNDYMMASYDADAKVFLRYGQKKLLMSYTCTTGDLIPQNIDIIAPTQAAQLVINTKLPMSTGNVLSISPNEDLSRKAKAKASSSSSNVSFGSGRRDAPPLQPCVTCDYVLGLIKKQTGGVFDFGEVGNSEIGKLAIPLVSRTADENTVSGEFSAKLEDYDHTQWFFPSGGDNIVLPLTVNDELGVFSCQKGKTYNEILVNTDCKVDMNVHFNWRLDMSKAKPSGYDNEYYNGTTTVVAYYLYTSNYIEITVLHSSDDYNEDNADIYIVGKNERIRSYENNLVNNNFIHYAYGGGSIELNKGDKIRFVLRNPYGYVMIMSNYNAVVTASVKVGDDVPTGGMFPIGINLPECKVIDFIRFLSLITGTFPLQKMDGKVAFVPYDEVWNSSDALDWSDRLIAKDRTNTPRNMEYSISGYARNNRYLWAQDDTVYGTYDGDLMLDNETLDYEKNAWTLPFAASDGNRVPIYDWEETTFTNKGNNDSEVTYRTATKYSKCKDRIMTMRKTETGQAALIFDISLNNIFATKYKFLRKALEHPHVIKEYLYLTDLEIMNFDETVPVYLAQYGAYFAVTELKVNDKGYTEATMIQLEF